MGKCRVRGCRWTACYPGGLCFDHYEAAQTRAARSAYQRRVRVARVVLDAALEMQDEAEERASLLDRLFRAKLKGK